MALGRRFRRILDAATVAGPVPGVARAILLERWWKRRAAAL